MLELNQQKLHELEAKCTKEQPPAAMAACPLHVDCREICRAIAASDFSKARELYEKNAVFPGILSHLCEEPCKSACIRTEHGGPMQLRLLESAAQAYGSLKKRRTFLSKRPEKAAVVGAGLTGSSAALELGKKGYSVTVFEKAAEPGGFLLTEKRLPKEVLQKDLERLKEYKIEIHTLYRVDTIETLTEQFDAVLLAWGLHTEPVVTDPMTFSANGEKLFAAGDARRTNSGTITDALSEGRRAAISIDRYLKKVSLTAGREAEGGFSTTLHVTLKDGKTVSSVLSSGLPSKEEAIQEASRCLECTCTDCIDACAFMRRYKAWPKKYLREVYNNLAIAMGTRHANKMINSCSLCGQCSSVCPHGLDLGEVIQEARNIMVSQNKMPASAFEFALNDLAFSNSKHCFLVKPDPDQAQPSYLYFPGCQLAASTPNIVWRSYHDLRSRLPGGTGIMLGCCGIMAKWAGRMDLYQETIEQLKKSWESLGCPEVITACPACLTSLSESIPRMHCTGIWEILHTFGLPDTAWPESPPLRIHDACQARNSPGIREQIRLLAHTCGFSISEGNYTGTSSGCCGYGGLTQFSNPSLADEMAGQCISDTASPFLTYCINCRDRFLKQGAEAYHILELIYSSSEDEHRWPSYSVRQQNRMDLKRRLSKELWGEDTEGEMPLKLYYDSETADLLERRMILERDICSVITAAEETRERIHDTRSGLYIAHKMVGNVTFWVWYLPREDGYEISRVYAHRMEIKGDM